jgi:hypothetical protein
MAITALLGISAVSPDRTVSAVDWHTVVEPIVLTLDVIKLTAAADRTGTLAEAPSVQT